MMIDRKKLEEILDKQYQHCKRNIIDQILINMEKLQNYRGDVIDIRTEINMGKSMEGTLFYEIIEDYHNKDSFVIDSVPEGEDPYNGPISLDKLFWPDLNNNNILDSVKSAPTKEQFTKQELKQLVDMLVSLMIYMKHVESPKLNEVKTIYLKILELL